MTMDDDGRREKKPVHVVGEDLATLSVDELRERVEMLRAEITRIEAAVTAKEASRTVADTFFKS